MEKRTTLRELVAQGQIMAPCVFDNISVRTTELCNYKAAVLDGNELAYAMCGFPNSTMLNAEEIIWLAHRMTDCTSLPLIVDIRNGYGSSELNCYVNAYRLAKNNVMAIIVDDSLGTDDLESCTLQAKIVPTEIFYARVKAVKQACENTDCIVIARTEGIETIGLNDAISRCIGARKHGADITGIVGLKNVEQAKEFQRQEPGVKMWFSLGALDGCFDVEPAAIDSLNFKLVSFHYAVKGAFWGMLYYGKRTLEDGNTVFHDTHDFDGLLMPGQDYHELFSFWKKWLPIEDDFNDVSDVMAKTYDIRL